jgi:hypothetical protein
MRVTIVAANSCRCAYWQPTAASYFNRVSKERIVEVVREGVSAQAADNIARMKKQAMAEAAEAALAGKAGCHHCCAPLHSHAFR